MAPRKKSSSKPAPAARKQRASKAEPSKKIGPWDMSDTAEFPAPDVMIRDTQAGRRRVTEMIDMLIGDGTNIETLRKALQEKFEANPIQFFKEIVMPLLPKESKVEASVAVNSLAAGIITAMSNDAE